MSLPRLLNVAYSLIVDDAGLFADRAEVRSRLDALMAGQPLADVPETWNRETWGTGPDAEAAQKALMGVVGGPAPPRPS